MDEDAPQPENDAVTPGWTEADLDALRDDWERWFWGGAEGPAPDY